jgi:hypothetical protein
MNQALETIKGKIKAGNGLIFSWSLIPNKALTVRGLVVQEFDAENITQPDQVIRFIDDEITDVKEYKIELDSSWKVYR